MFRSESQSLKFDHPFQCGTDPKLPYDAFDTEHEVQDNDIFILASDGVLDNLYDEDIANCILPASKHSMYDPVFSDEHLQATSACISHASLELSYDKLYVSPFEKEAAKHGVKRPGGKPDDIVSIVA